RSLARARHRYGSPRGEECGAEPSCSPVRAPADTSRRWLVDLRPENAELAKCFDEPRERDRFDDVRVDSALVAGRHVSLLSRGGEHDHWDHLELWIRLDLPQHLEPVELG